MATLNIGIEIRDFDLERMGFSLSVLDESKKRQASEAYLRMTLIELHAFLKALKAADDEVELTTYDSNGVNKLPPMKGMGGREVEPEQRAPAATSGWRRSSDTEVGCNVPSSLKSHINRPGLNNSARPIDAHMRQRYSTLQAAAGGMWPAPAVHNREEFPCRRLFCRG